MKIFLDTSSLIKLYHTEKGTDELDRLLDERLIQEIYLSDISKIEFISAIWKKVRTKELTPEVAVDLIGSFQSDYTNYSFIATSNHLITLASELVTKYGLAGLRTLDSVQLSSIISVRGEIDMAVTADDLLKVMISKEGIKSN